MFEIASKNRLKTYKGKRISLPGKTRGLVKITDIGLDGSRAKIVRKWRKIKAGQKAYELKSSPWITDMSFIFQKTIGMRFLAKRGLILTVILLVVSIFT